MALHSYFTLFTRSTSRVDESFFRIAYAYRGQPEARPLRRLWSSIISPLLIPMTTQASHLSKLPVEVLEQIFLFLPGQDIVKIEAVRTALQMACSAGFDFLVLMRYRFVDASWISFSILPLSNISEPSFLPACATIRTFLATFPNVREHTRNTRASGPTQGG